jgi:hypothetical protein
MINNTVKPLFRPSSSKVTVPLILSIIDFALLFLAGYRNIHQQFRTMYIIIMDYITAYIYLTTIVLYILKVHTFYVYSEHSTVASMYSRALSIKIPVSHI